MAKDLVKKEDQLISELEQELIKEQASQLDNPQFMAIKVKHAGVQRFEMPVTDEEDEPKLLKTFSGVIVFNHKMNSYWSKPFGEGEDRIPDCFALDAIHGTKYGLCKECKFNKFGSGPDGKGKACRNMWRLYIYLNKKMLLPYQLTLSPTSLKNFQNYIISLLSLNLSAPRVITTFGLVEGNQGSSIVTFKKKDLLPAKDFLYYMEKRKKLLAFMQSAVFFDEAKEEENKEEPIVDTATFVDYGEDSDQEEIPF